MMKKVKVELTGITPLLMNSPKAMLDAAKDISSSTEKRNLAEEAEKLLYVMKDGTLYIPSEAVKGSLVNAASYKKFGKYSAKPIVAGSVFIQPNEISLGTKKYELDIRTVVVQRRNRIVKARPMLRTWKVEFELTYNSEFIANGENLIKPILIEAGQRVGLLDFRPQKLGSFGMFEVTLWKEMK